jgi:hypothetical protein
MSYSQITIKRRTMMLDCTLHSNSEAALVAAFEVAIPPPQVLGGGGELQHPPA